MDNENIMESCNLIIETLVRKLRKLQRGGQDIPQAVEIQNQLNCTTSFEPVAKRAELWTVRQVGLNLNKLEEMRTWKKALPSSHVISVNSAAGSVSRATVVAKMRVISQTSCSCQRSWTELLGTVDSDPRSVGEVVQNGDELSLDNT